MNEAKIVEIADQFDDFLDDFMFSKEALLAFARALIEEERGKTDELIERAEATTAAWNINLGQGWLESYIDSLRDAVERIKGEEPPSEPPDSLAGATPS